MGNEDENSNEEFNDELLGIITPENPCIDASKDPRFPSAEEILKEHGLNIADVLTPKTP